MLAGGYRSILYTLNAARKIGFLKFFTAVFSKNTCKTCALGMGGQRGGMRNELGKFPEICKKSVQAQLTDIQGAINPNLFHQNTIESFGRMSGRELEALGRITRPLYKPLGSDSYRIIDWEPAMRLTIERFAKADPQRTFFYSSGRSSNEAAFLLQLFARLYGTNNINNCSYYCHQASGVGLSGMLGTGTATVELSDLEKADLIFVIGANPSSNHPRFMRELMACRRRGGRVIVINPVKEKGLVRFSVPSDFRSLLFGGSSIASNYIQPHIGGDAALLKGIAKALVAAGKEDRQFIDGATRGFDDFIRDLEQTTWEEITRLSGIDRDIIEYLAGKYAAAENAVFTWAMGITHHLHGVENVESIANLALLRGMVGRRNAGLLPLRGHSNVQGVGSVGLTPQLKDAIFKNIEDQLKVQLPTSPGWDTMTCMEEAMSHNVEAAFILGGNLYGSNPDSRYAAESLGRIPFKVFLNTTLNLGHFHGVDQETLILPVAARDEEKQATSQESMFNFVRISDGKIMRFKDVRTETEIIAELGGALVDPKVFDFRACKNHANIRKVIAGTVPGYGALTQADAPQVKGRDKEFHIDGRVLHNMKFPTADGRAIFKAIKLPPRPSMATGSMDINAGLAGASLRQTPNRFTMMTVRSEGQFNSIIYEEKDAYRGQKNRWVVLMNSKDMKACGFRKDQEVDIRSETGVMQKVKVRPFKVKQGNILTYYPEANIIIPRSVDARSRTPAFKSIPVEVRA